MASNKYIAWLEDQLDNWIEEGLVSEEQAHAIRKRYSTDGSGSLNLSYLLLGSLATLLVGSGIVLIFAYQWEKLSDLAQGSLSTLPTLMGLAFFIYVYISRRKELVWRESASAFLMLMIAASMALWGQTFGVLAAAEQFWLVWVLISLPLLFIMNSTLAALLFALGLIGGTLESTDGYAAYFALLFLGFMAHFMINLRSNAQVTRINLLAWTLVIVFTVVWIANMQSLSGVLNFLGYTACLALLYILGHSKILSKHRQIYPWQLYAILNSFFLLIFFSVDSDLEAVQVTMIQEAIREAAPELTIWVIVMAAWLFLGFRHLWHNASASLLDYFFMVFPILFFAHLQLHGLSSELWVVISGSLIGLMGGAVYLKKGIEEESLFFINVGMLIILIILSIRFFNTDWSNLWKGIIFVLLGLIFLGLNVYLARKESRESA
ncbi:MAG TPA: DUF2157 domain-containing protein [Saprospiraceae bacterium]|nr:DUF2157 domain-containing protein [Saprospiraceae bacterium]